MGVSSQTKKTREGGPLSLLHSTTAEHLQHCLMTLQNQIAGSCNQRGCLLPECFIFQRVISSTFGGTSEAPSRPPRPLNMLRMEEGPEEGGPLAAGSAPGALGPCCAAGACLPGACRKSVKSEIC